jgi:hypothetical protein
MPSPARGRRICESVLGAMPKPTSNGCDLCGLPCRYGSHTATFSGKRLSFCCTGCRMVYSMLMEASASPDPAQFTQSDLYRRCVAAGVVPATEAELISGNTETTVPMVQHPPAAESETLLMRLTVSGMWCPACAWVIETALNRLGGVAHAACDYASDRLNCRYDPNPPTQVPSIMRFSAWDIPFPRMGTMPRAPQCAKNLFA